MISAQHLYLNTHTHTSTTFNNRTRTIIHYSQSEIMTSIYKNKTSPAAQTSHTSIMVFQSRFAQHFTQQTGSSLPIIAEPQFEK